MLVLDQPAARAKVRRSWAWGCSGAWRCVDMGRPGAWTCDENARHIQEACSVARNFKV